jgi:putative copper resistance protein D
VGRASSPVRLPKKARKLAKRQRCSSELGISCNDVLFDRSPLAAHFGLDSLGGFVFVRTGDRRTPGQEAARAYSAPLFILASIEPPGWLVDLVDRSNFVDSVALAHYSASMSGEDLISCLSSDALSTVLFSTEFGHLWLMRLAIGILFGIRFWMLERTPRGRTAPAVSLAWLSCIELVSLAWGGHAVAHPGPNGVVHLLSDALHLLTSAFWPGSLMPLATFFFVLLTSNRDRDLGLAAAIVRRFSTSSLIAVAVMVLTGLLNSLFMVGNLRVLLTTDYGRALISKVVLFLLMVGLGAWNLLPLKPSLAIDAPAMNVAHQKSAIRSLLRNVLLEIVLGAAVILIVATLGITPPPIR